MITKQQQASADELVANQRMIVDQREANEQMVSVTIRAQELMEQAEAAQARAEATTDDLRASEERYRALFELSPLGVYSCDASGAIERFNAHAAELWGREPAPGSTDEQFCGTFKMFRPDGSFLPYDQSPMAEVLSGKRAEARDEEVLIERPNGSSVTCVVNIRPLKSHRGHVSGAINCFYDVTERKRAEDLVGDSLARERALAEFREMFIGILGHDLRNPLSSTVVAAALLLRRGNLNAQDSETVGRIIRSSQRMTQMITQLLDLTRARLGDGLPIDRTSTDLHEICRNVVEEFEAPVQLEVDGDLTGEWDKDRLAEVLSNLAGNAIEHASPGTTVIVRARGAGSGIVVEIENHGDPIPADVLPFIFEPFRRARPEQTTKAGHLGLGLYIAKQIVLSHHGTLDARSADGMTTFVMRLPRAA